MAVTATASQYAEYMKEMNKDLSGVSQWEKYFLQPTQNTYEEEVATAQAKKQYNISGAYAAYKQQQLQLMQQNLFSEGVQKQLDTQLKQSYNSAIQEANATAYSEIASAQSAYQESVAAAEKDLTELGEQYNKFETALQQYAGERGYNPDFWKSMSYTEDGQERIDMTATGAYDIATLMYDAGSKDVADFRTWLSENYADEYDFYSSRQNEINAMYGIAKDFRGGDFSEYEKARNIERYIDTYLTRKNITEWDEEVLSRMGNVTRPAGMSDEEYAQLIKKQYEAAELEMKAEWFEDRNHLINMPQVNATGGPLSAYKKAKDLSVEDESLRKQLEGYEKMFEAEKKDKQNKKSKKNKVNKKDVNYYGFNGI